MKLEIAAALLIGSLFCIIPVSAQSTQDSPELQKLRVRLGELQTIVNQENAIINAYTRNRTVPVKEGSREYHACLRASERIQQAEAEAKRVAAKIEGLESGSPVDVGLAPTSEADGDPIETTVTYLVEQWKNSNEEEADENDSQIKSAEDLAERLFTRYDPRRFLHPCEHGASSLQSLGASVHLKGKQTSEISAWIDSRDWVALANCLLEESREDLGDVTRVEKASKALADREFFIQIVPTRPVFQTVVLTGFDPSDREEHRVCILPVVCFPEDEGQLYWETQILPKIPNPSGTLNGWEKHPDGEGYITKWQPRDGPAMLFSWPVHGKQREAIRNALGELSMGLASEWRRLQDKIELGELKEDEYPPKWIDARANAFKTWLSWTTKL